MLAATMTIIIFIFLLFDASICILLIFIDSSHSMLTVFDCEPAMLNVKQNNNPITLYNKDAH
jgi:hypothetical protein